MLRRVLHPLVRLLYRFRTYNSSVLATPGPVLLLPNHVSWWDWIFIGVCLDDDWRFVTSSNTAELSWLHRLIMVNRRTFPVNINSPYAIKHMAEYLQRGGRLVLFPEGRLSTTGSLMKLFDGTGFLIDKTHAKVITAYIRGAHRLPFSPNPDRKRWFPHVSVHFSAPLEAPRAHHLNVTESRLRLTDWLRDQMVRQKFETETAHGPQTVPEALLRSLRQQPCQVVLQDVTMQTLTCRRFITGARVLTRQWQTRLKASPERIGLLLPNVNAFPVALFSLWLADKIPAVLNYTNGAAALSSCIRLAGLKQIITSRSFLAHAELEEDLLRATGAELLFLEDIRTSISTADKLGAALRTFFNPDSICGAKPPDTAVILFTSGSEGEPKGVELTHANLLANIRQMLSVIDLMDSDRFFNALPLFHSFGLAVGLLLPLIHRAFVFLYPSPLHYRVVPAMFYNLDCTVFFGTNTFLAGYARKAHPYDFRTLRYVFAGAEKVQESTSLAWMRKFGVRVLEGYGATECSPCLSVNVPMHPCHGSAGKFLPGIQFKCEVVEGIPEPGTGDSDGTHDGTHAAPPVALGRLWVRGPNVMRGYLNPEANARFLAADGWYDTGDIVKVDGEGFVHILGRLKRFAKVSGEMVSLTAVEEALSGAFPQYGLRFGIAVVTRPDEIKGEKLVAVTTDPRLTLEQVREALRARNMGSLAVPRELKLVPEIPQLGSGKVNYRELQAMLEAKGTPSRTE